MNGADDKRKCSPRDLICDEEMDEGEVEEDLEAEEEAAFIALGQSQVVMDEDCAEVVREEARIWSGAGPAAGKQPMAVYDDMLDEGDVRDECPDLAEYFAQYQGLEEVSQIAMCRTYANYLASKQRQQRPRTKRVRM